MAKLVKTFEDGITTTVLTFRDEEYTLEMKPCRGGKSSTQSTFDAQFEEKHPGDPDLEEIMELLDSLSYGYDETNVEECLNNLEGYEGGRS